MAKNLTKTERDAENYRREHKRLADLAEARGDIATATDHIELIGKSLGMFLENRITVNIDVGREGGENVSVIEEIGPIA
jgi:hypothetical protein